MYCVIEESLFITLTKEVMAYILNGLVTIVN